MVSNVGTTNVTDQSILEGSLLTLLSGLNLGSGYFVGDGDGENKEETEKLDDFAERRVFGG